MTHKIKHVSLNLSVDPEIKIMLQAAAEADRRSISALIELLILENCPGIINKRRQMYDKTSEVK